MTNAHPAANRPEPGDQANPGDWHELRGELRSLLEKVDLSPVAEPPEAPEATGTDDQRHIEALRTVNRAVARLNEREDGLVAEEPVELDRDMVRAAIEEIRGRQARPFEDSISRIQPQTPFASLATAISAANNRLGEIEAQLIDQHGTATNVKAIAGQIAEITNVVEMLAGAVSDRDQTDGLEAQIHGLRELISEGAKPDLSGLTTQLDTLANTVNGLVQAQAEHIQHLRRITDAQSKQTDRIEQLSRESERADFGYLTRRLDDVSATVERLADLQIQQVQQLARDAKEAPQRAEAVKSAMQSVEAAVRSVYDRIDAVERTQALPSDDLDGLADGMTRITQMLADTRQSPDALLPLIEALDTKLDIALDNSAVVSLKDDLAGLRSALIEAIEPRFKAIETQIGTLDSKLSEREGPSDAALAQIEAQVRQLVARMDQTGEQLSNLSLIHI